MRIPFEQLPSGCDPLGFDIDFIPDGFTLCTIPDVTRVTVAPFTWHIDVPFNPPPPYCPCFPTLAAFNLNAKVVSQNEPPAALVQIIPTGDCCDLDLRMFFTMNIPCMPLTLGPPGQAANLDLNTDSPAIDLNLNMNNADGTCELQLDVDLVIPCLPLDAFGDGLASIGNKTETPEIDVIMGLKPGTCAIDLQVDMMVPCMPLGFSSTGTIVGTEITDPLIAVSLGRIALDGAVTLDPVNFADTCKIAMNMSIQIPCIPMSFAKGAQNTFEDPMTGTFELRPSGCQIVIDAKVYPGGATGPIQVIHTLVFSSVGGVPALYAQQLLLSFEKGIFMGTVSDSWNCVMDWEFLTQVPKNC